MGKPPDAPPEPVYGDNEDAEYIDLVWGILRHPATCSLCGGKTRTPYFTEIERLKPDRKPLCGMCYRESQDWPPGTLWVGA